MTDVEALDILLVVAEDWMGTVYEGEVKALTGYDMHDIQKAHGKVAEIEKGLRREGQRDYR